MQMNTAHRERLETEIAQPYGIGVSLSLVLSVFATGTGLDRSRAFYPTLLMVIASYYRRRSFATTLGN